MRSAILLAPLFALVLACSSNDSSGTGNDKTSPPPSQTPNAFQASDGGDGVNTVTIAIKGKGAVESRDGKSVDCTSDGTTTTGACTAYTEDTVYAVAPYGSRLDHWEPTGSKAPTVFVMQSTPTQLTAVFVTD